ncbi:hypothetical protein [Natrononativus amylolyticus]|uniref:hypothetical protein n=1 Tax=Natrononativus amylolyticus TaxID=2963434 RepID=UPI0031F32AE0
MKTYRLELRDTTDGIDADLLDEDGLVETSTRIAYEDHGLEPAGDREEPSSTDREVTADVTTLDVQYERDGDGFTVRVLGDREELVTERVEDEEWGLE